MTNAFVGEGAATAGGEMPDLRTYLRVLWRWKFLLLAFLVAIPVAAYLYEHGRPKVYQSSAVVAITGGQSTGVAALLNQVVYSGTDTTDLLIDARLLTTPAVAREAARFVRPPANPASLAASVSTSTDQGTGFLTITASAGAPRQAAEIANAFARALVVDQTRALVKQVNVAIAQLQTQIGLTTTRTARAQLSQQLARFQALRASQGAGVELIERASAPGSPVAPRVERTVILGVIVGLLLGLGAVALAEVSDRRIRHPDEAGDSMDLGDAPGLPSLGAIPASAFSAEGHTSESEESCVTLRASLTYFNVDRQISSVLITSPGKEDGKTTVAVGLAEALARAGKEVILLDADLRRPAAGARLGIASSEGLGAVLVGAKTLDEALLERPSQNGHAGRLRVLPAGMPPPNPSELLGSLRMRELLSELAERAEIVLIDSSPLLTVSDSMPLVPLVSGVVLIARLNRTSRDAMTRLRFVVRAAGGNALGVVTTGAASGGLYVAPGYGYETAYVNSDGEAGPAVGRRRRLGRRGPRAPAGK
jgi:capsular exopolysaccharide synthesis family protein